MVAMGVVLLVLGLILQGVLNGAGRTGEYLLYAHHYNETQHGETLGERKVARPRRHLHILRRLQRIGEQVQKRD